MKEILKLKKNHFFFFTMNTNHVTCHIITTTAALTNASVILVSCISESSIYIVFSETVNKMAHYFPLAT